MIFVDVSDARNDQSSASQPVIDVLYNRLTHVRAETPTAARMEEVRTVGATRAVFHGLDSNRQAIRFI
jgi:hypothetical protein